MSNQLRCDRCGKERDFDHNGERPEDWIEVDGMDFCPGCYAEFLKWVQRLGEIQKGKEK